VTGFGAGAVIAVLTAATAATEPAKPLAPEDCQRVRLALEQRLPFGPGFRPLEVEFPKNDNNIEGHVCRLLTMGTGAHMEGFSIESLTDMRTKVMAALNAGGWTENAETGRFAEKSTHGREVFALSGTTPCASPPPSSAWSTARTRAGSQEKRQGTPKRAEALSAGMVDIHRLFWRPGDAEAARLDGQSRPRYRQGHR
jgi:hypothetical protein